MSVSLKDIADKLNLSVSTVSRVANNKGNVKPATQAIVEKALKEYNYTPNQIARSLKNKSTNTIGIIVPDISEIFFSNIFKGLESTLNRFGYTIILCDTEENPVKEELYLNLLIEKQIDGIVVASVIDDESVYGKLFDLKLPVVFMDNLPYIRTNYDSVSLDNRKASLLAVDLLVSHGHRKIGTISGKMTESSCRDRKIGFVEAMNHFEIDTNEALIKEGDSKEDSGYKRMTEMLESGLEMTAVYVTSSKMTYGAIKAIKDKGLKIPGDISLVGFDVHDESGLMIPSVTTILQPAKEIGEISGEIIVEKIKNPDKRYSKRIVTEPELIIKETVDFLKKG